MYAIRSYYDTRAVILPGPSNKGILDRPERVAGDRGPMMRQMREFTKPLILLALLAFVALMIFQWGMDITGRSGGSLGEIGSYNFV